MYLRPNKSSVKYYLQDKWTKFTSFPLGACVCLFVYEFDIHMHMITIRKHKGKDHIFKSNRTNKINPIGIYIPKPYGKCWLILFNYFIIQNINLSNWFPVDSHFSFFPLYLCLCYKWVKNILKINKDDLYSLPLVVRLSY